MELNILSILVGIIGSAGVIVALWYLIGFTKNLNRYGRPSYMPRDDEALWARVMASSRRLWSYQSISASDMSYDNWDLGILKVNPKRLLTGYGTRPRVTDVILVPKKWGGHWVAVITRELRNNRYVTTYIGEFYSGKIYRSRSPEDSVSIS